MFTWCWILIFIFNNGNTQFVEFWFCFSVTGTFTCSLKFIVKDCDPNTGEPDEDGYDDEYVVRV